MAATNQLHFFLWAQKLKVRNRCAGVFLKVLLKFKMAAIIQKNYGREN